MKTMLKALALMLAVVLALPLGALAEANPETLLATVNGTDILIDEAYAEYEYYAYIYRLYGMEDEMILDWMPYLNEETMPNLTRVFCVFA